MTSMTETIRSLIDSLPAEDRKALIANFASPGPAPKSLRLLRPVEAARAMGISTTTLWRLRKEQKLRTVALRRGAVRIPEEEIRAFVEGRT